MRKNKKEPKELVENCLSLEIKRFTREVSMSGNIILYNNEHSLDIQYEISNDALTIEYNGKNQCLEIAKVTAFRGVRTFFVCECEKRCANLYLRLNLNGERFGCRICNNLTYLVNRVTRDTVNGAVFSDFSRLTKLIERREKIRSPWYRGEPTKKFQKILSDAARYGFHEFVSWQRSGIKDLQDMKRVVEIAKNG